MKSMPFINGASRNFKRQRKPVRLLFRTSSIANCRLAYPANRLQTRRLPNSLSSGIRAQTSRCSAQAELTKSTKKSIAVKKREFFRTFLLERRRQWKILRF